MKNPGPIRTAILSMLAALAVSSASAGEDSAIAVLDHPGQPQLVIAGDSRVLATFDAQPDGLRLTLLLSTPALGPEVVRTQVRLVEGQQHRIILRGSDDEREGDSFTFTRQGERIDIVAFDGDNDRQVALLGQ